ncbi:MAG: hypothetical protein IJ748_04065 [Bacteroidales bacterium]|nr:hypothetical protein [Bacteroidales bacterium]
MKKKAEVFKCRKEYGKAAFTLRRIPPYSLSQGEKDTLAYQVLLYYYLEDNFSEAEKYIKTLDLNVSENPSSQLLLIEILLLNELKEYTSAYEKLIAYEEKTGNFSAESKKCLDSLYSHIPKLKSETKAKNLSLFPGLGQIYAGYYTEGIFAFGLNAAILSFGVYELWHKDFVTAWIGGAGILSATYLGQQKQAVYLAQKRNYKRLSEFNKKIKTVILSEFE